MLFRSVPVWRRWHSPSGRLSARACGRPRARSSASHPASSTSSSIPSAPTFPLFFPKREESSHNSPHLLPLNGLCRARQMYLTRLGNAAFKASLSSQARKSDRVFIPSAVILTISGFGLSIFGLHQLDSSRRLTHQTKLIR